jgi:pyruvate dehydrogenase E2 component (dihydrolipoamide acetyltransferase)
MAQIDLTVPDLGGFNDVPVIEVLVKPGDVVKKDDPLVTLESDKATMEVPAYASGTIADVKVKVGDKVSQGTVLATAEPSDAQSATPVTPPAMPANDAVGIIAADAGASMEAAAPPPRATDVQSQTQPQSRPSAAPSGSASSASSAAGGGEAIVELKVPDIGGFGDVPVIEVLVAPGETVAKEAPLITLESDKATMEVPASEAGTIRELRVKVGDKVSQGTVIATLATTASKSTLRQAQGDTAAGHDASGSPQSSKSESVTKSSPDANVTLSPSKADARENAAPNGRASTATAPPQTASTNGAATGETAAHPASTGPVHASPAIRRFARELGVDLARVHGSGPNGRITREDVQGFVKTALVSPPAAAPGVHAGAVSGFGLGLPPWPSVDFAKFGPVERVALTRIQRISGPVLARNWVMIPHVTQNDDADVTDLEAFRKQINAERKDVKVTMLAFLMKAAVAALKRYPQFNSSLDGDELVLKKYYHLGFAADTPNGLLVPVIKDVDKKGVIEIAAETAALAAKARDGKLGPNDMSGATFTISSLGSIGGTYFTPIINAPEVAILGACKAETRPVWDGAQFVPRLIQPLSLSYDHRVIDGANAARFTVEIKNALTDLRRVLL